MRERAAGRSLIRRGRISGILLERLDTTPPRTFESYSIWMDGDRPLGTAAVESKLCVSSAPIRGIEERRHALAQRGHDQGAGRGAERHRGHAVIKDGKDAGSLVEPGP